MMAVNKLKVENIVLQEFTPKKPVTKSVDTRAKPVAPIRPALPPVTLSSNDRKENKSVRSVSSVKERKDTICLSDSQMLRNAVLVVASWITAESDSEAAGGLEAQHAAANGVSRQILEGIRTQMKDPKNMIEIDRLIVIGRKARVAKVTEENLNPPCPRRRLLPGS